MHQTLYQSPFPTLPTRESEDLGVLGDLEKFTIASTTMYLLHNLFFYHCKYQNPSSPIWESEDFDVLKYLENITIAGTRIPSPTGESEYLDILGDLKILTIAISLCICYVIFCFILPLQVPEPPPSIGESEDLDVLEDLENFTCASTGTPLLPHNWHIYLPTCLKSHHIMYLYNFNFCRFCYSYSCAHRRYMPRNFSF